MIMLLLLRSILCMAKNARSKKVCIVVFEIILYIRSSARLVDKITRTCTDEFLFLNASTSVMLGLSGL